MIDQIKDNLSTTNVLIAVVAAYIVFYIAREIRDEFKIYRLGGQAPRVKSWVPWGLDVIYDAIQHAFRHENLQFWDGKFMSYGNPNNPYTVYSYAGGQRVIFTADPENVKAILATQFNDYGKGPRFHRDFEEFLGDSIFNVDHEIWHQSRQLIRPQFIKDRVSDLETFEHHVEILLPQLGGGGREVDVKDLFFKFTLDAATHFLLGRSVGSLEEGGDKIGFAHAFGEIQRIQTIIARAGPLNFLVNKKAFRQHIKTLNDFVEPYIDETLRLSPDELEKRNKGDQGYTFLHALASYTRDRKVLRDQIVAVLLAGRDTTACTLSWCFYELSKHPDLVAELRQEIERTVGLDNPPTYDHLKSMKLLQHTMNETLRLYPVVPFNVRVALKDTTLPHGGGPDGNSPIGILKHTPIGYSTHYMQLTQEIYPSPAEKPNFTHPLIFDPHRWETWQPKPWTYIPFNGGPRLCVGQQFALTEMGYTIVRILQKFRTVECRVPPKQGGPSMEDAMSSTGGVRGQVGGDGVGMTGVYEKGGSESGAGLVNSKGIRGLRGVGKSNVRTMADGRELKYKSEIVLQPVEAVKVAFFE